MSDGKDGEEQIDTQGHIAYALAAKSLVNAARRAHEDGQIEMRNALLDDADAVLGLMVDAMPQEARL